MAIDPSVATARPAVARSSAPSSLFDGVGRLFDYSRITYRRTWKGSVINSFVTPLLYVVAMGVLLGGFIQGNPAQLEGATSYLAFVAPGLVAAQAMQLAIGETTYPVMGMVKWNKTYFGMTASPLSAGQIVVAQLGFILFRVGTSCGVFLLVMAPFGVFDSVGGVLVAFLVQLLVGLAFAAPVFAYSVGAKSEASFALIFRLGVIPLFLFSGRSSRLRTWAGCSSGLPGSPRSGRAST